MPVLDSPAVTANTLVFGTGFDFDLFVRVEAKIGSDSDGRWKSFPVDQKTGIIAIPEEHLWHKLESASQSRKPEIARNLVSAFRASIWFRMPAGYRVFVTQRPGNGAYEQINGRRHGDSLLCEIPATKVQAKARTEIMQSVQNAGPVAVFTANNNHNGSGTNRTDVWIMAPSGEIRLIQVMIITLDNGRIFRLVNQNRWEGQAMRLKHPAAYKPEMNEDVFKDPAIRELLKGLIFVPAPTHPGFDVRAHILQFPAFREFLRKGMGGFKVYDGHERNFPATRTAPFEIKGRGGFVKFFGHDMGCGGFGIVHQPQPTGKDKEFQVHYQGFNTSCVIDGEMSTIKDPQGLLDLQRGDIVIWDDEIDMGEGQLPLLVNPRVQYMAQQ